MPWDELTARIKPLYYKNKFGRPARGVETMLRMFLLQAWFGLSARAVEDSIYDSYAFRTFMGLDFTREQVPDAKTLYRFRRLLADNGLDKIIFGEIDRRLGEYGRKLRGGAIAEAAITEARPLKKSRGETRELEE